MKDLLTIDIACIISALIALIALIRGEIRLRKNKLDITIIPLDWEE